jgi:hypothetical protein
MQSLSLGKPAAAVGMTGWRPLQEKEVQSSVWVVVMMEPEPVHLPGLFASDSLNRAILLSRLSEDWD